MTAGACKRRNIGGNQPERTPEARAAYFTLRASLTVAQQSWGEKTACFESAAQQRTQFLAWYAEYRLQHSSQLSSAVNKSLRCVCAGARSVPLLLGRRIPWLYARALQRYKPGSPYFKSTLDRPKPTRLGFAAEVRVGAAAKA